MQCTHASFYQISILSGIYLSTYSKTFMTSISLYHFSHLHCLQPSLIPNMPYSSKFSILDIYICNEFLIEEPTPRNSCQSIKIGCTVRSPGGSSYAVRRCMRIWVLPRISSTALHTNIPILQYQPPS